ncbi:MAG: hypothetical protein KGQ16_01705 [Cyanobacteria bacterium REEB444]|nr:hypothetical protein [Cyanobacteria bacterium REEB444]
MSGIMLSQDNDQLDFKYLNVQEESTVFAGLTVTDRAGNRIKLSDGTYIIGLVVANGVGSAFLWDETKQSWNPWYGDIRSISGT